MESTLIITITTALALLGGVVTHRRNQQQLKERRPVPVRVRKNPNHGGSR